MTDSLRKTETSSVPPLQRTSDVFSYPPSASPFDQNSKLWESIMPPPKPPLYAAVKRRVGALSDGLFQLPVTGTLTNLAERLPQKIPGWQRLGYGARWSILTGAGMALAFTLTWSFSRGSSAPSENDTSAPLAQVAVSQTTQTAHALKPAALQPAALQPAALPAMPVAVATPEPEATRIPTSSMPNPDDGAAAPAELEPNDKPAAKTKPAKGNKRKLTKSKARGTKKARPTRSASR
ncbi:MAG: hypothetical protein ABW217_01910 [Polyangiaceae bacterium]